MNYNLNQKIKSIIFLTVNLLRYFEKLIFIIFYFKFWAFISLTYLHRSMVQEYLLKCYIANIYKTWKTTMNNK